MQYPVAIATERLEMRPLVFEDYQWWLPFMKDPQAIRFLLFSDDWTPEDRAKAWMERQLKRYEDEQFGLTALIDKTTGEPVGQCGLLSQEVDGKPELEIGYHILPIHWGKGFATEAAVRFKNFAFEHQIADSVISIIAPENFASQKVAQKNGLQFERATRFRDCDVQIFRISAKTWKKQLVSKFR